MTNSSGYGLAAGLALAVGGCSPAGHPDAAPPRGADGDPAAKQTTQPQASTSELGHRAEQGSPASAGNEIAADTEEARNILAGSDDGKPRLYAPSGLVTIHEKPDRDAPVIGAMRGGQSVVMTDTSLPPVRTLKRHYQCDEGWYPVAPRGFVCVGGANHATKDADDPRVVAARAALPDISSDYPFKYGTSVGAPQYLRIPTEAEQKEVEGDVATYRTSLPTPNDAKGGAVSAATVGRKPPEAILKYIESAKPGLTHADELYDGYRLSWTQEFDANGRTWLFTPAMTFVPKDKVRIKKLPDFEGIDLKAHPEVKLPLSFFWLDDTKKFVPGADGKLTETADTYKRHSFTGVTMKQAAGPGGLVYWELSDGGYVKYSDITIIQKIPMRPQGVGPTDKWIDVRVTWGFLMAYEGDTPVYATAISPGVDGINAATHSTARGKHHVDWKLYSGDMSGKDRGKEWFVDEVPWVQYYKANYALHGAWWHNNFGRPMSHGCINMSPPDARNMFGWMDPQIPDGWYAVSAYYPYARGTLIVIRP